MITSIIVILALLNILGIFNFFRQKKEILKLNKRELIQGVVPENVWMDRQKLLQLLAISFHKSDRLILEKKQPTSKNVILVLQLRNGNARFSLPEVLVPQEVLKRPIYINPNKINFKNTYRLIDELVEGKE